MVRNIPHNLADALALGIVVGAKMVVEWIKEKMAVQFIAAGVRFPKPFAVGALWPARFINLPEHVAFILLAVALQTAEVWIRPIDGSNSTRDVSFGRHVLTALRHLLQKTQRFERHLRALLCFQILAC